MGLGRIFGGDDDDDAETKHRLHDISVDEVSTVDRAANRRRFLILKRSDEMGDSPEVIKDEDGNLITKKPDDAADKAELMIPGPVKEAVTRSATEALNRLQSLVNMVKTAGATDEESKTPLPAKIGAELKAVAGMLGGIGEKYPSPMSKDEDGAGDGEVEKADDGSAKILAALEDLKKLLAEPTEKAEDEKPQAPDLSGIAKAFDGLAAAIGKQNEELAEIRKSHGGSRSIVAEGGDDNPVPPKVTFPLDLAAEWRENNAR